jgi:hypothetical protein
VLAAIHCIGISQRQSNILAINEEHDYEKPLRKWLVLPESFFQVLQEFFDFR